jgi:ribonuclease III
MDMGILEAKLGVKFNDPNWLLAAVTHSSYTADHPDHPVQNNERLEFIGDAVIGLLVAEHLFVRGSNHSEGVMTQLRSDLVNRKRLGALALEMGLGEFLLSSGMKRDHWAILGNCFEAIVGAIYMDQGGEACRDFLQRFLLNKLPPQVNGSALNSKSLLIRRMRDAAVGYPSFSVIERTGSDHEPRFLVMAHLRDKELGRGWGGSRRAAEFSAASDALIKKFYLNGN